MAGPATHLSAEPESLVVKVDPDERHWLLEEAPETYYLPESYRPHPVVLVRLSKVDQSTLHDLLAAAWRLTSRKGQSDTLMKRRRRTPSIFPRRGR